LIIINLHKSDRKYVAVIIATVVVVIIIIFIIIIILFQMFPVIGFANPANMMDTCSESENAQYVMPCTPNDREMMLIVGRRDLHLNVYLEHSDSWNFPNLTFS
jgi:hypothetical protein